MVLWAAVSEARGGSLLALAGRCEQIEAARSSDEVRSRTTRALIPRLPAELENSDLCSCVCVCVCERPQSGNRHSDLNKGIDAASLRAS